MFNRYFQQELDNLRELAADFSKAHPALAPMLGGPTSDPDVERLLEGTAFLTALLRQKLDDEFPEIIHELVQLIWPHYLRPIASMTIIAFTPKPALKQSMTVPAGIHIASLPVEGTSCFFKTCYDVTVHPLILSQAFFEQSAGCPPTIKLQLELQGTPLSDWQPGLLRFFLAGDFSNAADLYLLLQNHLKWIEIKPLEAGQSLLLTPDHLRPVGFLKENKLFPYPSNSFPGYRILQEYFILPSKFLFLDLVGWERWHHRGEGNRFEICFTLDDFAISPPKIKTSNFVLGATPAINIFNHEADPIRLDHRKTDYVVRPSGSNTKHYQIYALEKVTGFVQGTAEERTYVPFDMFSSMQISNPVYYTKVRRSPIHSGFNVFLSFAYPPKAGLPPKETISIQMQCTNGRLAEEIKIGDICQPTSSSPEFVEFKNITRPTSNVLPPVGTNVLWRLLSHLSLNYLSLSKAENLRALLELYIFEETRDKPAIMVNRKRIAGIKHVETKGTQRLIAGIMMRGRNIDIKLRQDHFAGPGDLYLFGSILDHFLGNYASINTYTQLSIQETIKGDLYKWPARIGAQPLI
jgi:type VI secretion system protein ImpG